MKRFSALLIRQSLLLAVLPVAGGVFAQAPAPAAAAASPARPAIERQEIRAQLLPRRYTTIAAEIGAKVNRLNYAADNLNNVSMNTSASRSRIQDTDYAQATTELARRQIIQQAATAMLAQANQQPSVGAVSAEVSTLTVSPPQAKSSSPGLSRAFLFLAWALLLRKHRHDLTWLCRFTDSQAAMVCRSRCCLWRAHHDRHQHQHQIADFSERAQHQQPCTVFGDGTAVHRQAHQQRRR